jgi:hypothetical protein
MTYKYTERQNVYCTVEGTASITYVKKLKLHVTYICNECKGVEMYSLHLGFNMT